MSNSNIGSFVPTTNVWDIQRVQQLDIDPGLKELLVRLYQNINNISISLNTRDAGFYQLQEFVNGQIFFQNPYLNSTTPQTPIMRQVFRMVVNFGPLPNSSTISILHNINVLQSFTFTRIYGAATMPNSAFIPIPYASVTNSSYNIELDVNTTSVTITTAQDYSPYTSCYVVLEYIKS